MEQRFSRLRAQTCWVGVVLGGTATLYFLLGLAGYVHNLLLNFGVALVLLAALLFFFYQFLRAAKGSGWVGWSIWLAILIILVFEILLGLLPPTSRDELTHHLAMP